jgi:hypothetical protein
MLIRMMLCPGVTRRRVPARYAIAGPGSSTSPAPARAGCPYLLLHGLRQQLEPLNIEEWSGCVACYHARRNVRPPI